jgi:hypothetical protein
MAVHMSAVRMTLFGSGEARTATCRAGHGAALNVVEASQADRDSTGTRSMLSVGATVA